MPFHDSSFSRMVTVSPYPVPLTPKLLRAFCYFAEYSMNNGRPIPLKKIRTLFKFDPTQYNSWAQLRHHGLIEQVSGTKCWRLTPLGEQFYTGDASIYSVAGAWRSRCDGDTIDETDEVWKNWQDTNRTHRRKVFISDLNPETIPRQLSREEYADNRAASVSAGVGWEGNQSVIL